MRIILRTETGLSSGLYDCVTYIVPFSGPGIVYFHRSNKRALNGKHLAGCASSDVSRRFGVTHGGSLVESRLISIPDRMWDCIVGLERLPSVPRSVAAKLATAGEIAEYVSIRKLVG